MAEIMQQQTETQPKRRRRQSSATKSRSRSGCLTCKSKHIKCDEARPNCRKCTDKGLRCGGYWKGLKWSYKHQPTVVDDGEDQLSPREFILSDLVSGDNNDTSIDPNAINDTLDSMSARTPRSNSFSYLIPSPTGDEDDVEEIPCSEDSNQWLIAGSQPAMSLDFITEPTSEVSTATNFGTEWDQLMPFTGLKVDSGRASASNAAAAAAAAAAATAAQNTIPPTPTPALGGPDATLSLISSWFDQVCPAWSAFDSGINLNRKLAADLWHTSASVFNSLQSMSASFIAARLPQMRQPALSLLRTATVCIQAEARSLRGKERLDTVPAGLLYSLFCLGTTVCWLETGRLGLPFLREARYILLRLRQQSVAKTEEDRKLLAFFGKSLMYWEMLLAVVEDGGLDDPSESRVRECRSMSIEEDPDPIVDLLPHPWTGVSPLTQRLFSRSMRLCRAYRRKLVTPLKDLPGGFEDLEDARRLEEQLLELEFSSIAGLANMNETGDQRTPWLHLANVAEAYQLSSLLQLYVTFPELVALRLPNEPEFPWTGPVPWDRWIIPLTLRLVKLLEQIPPDSGSRVIQPLLYICASSGLRYECPSSNYDIEATAAASNFAPSDARNVELGTSFDDSIEILDYIDQMYKTTGGPSTATSPAAPVSRLTLEVANARSFILKRLDLLESTLQPKPVMVAKELVKAVWAAYDAEPAGFNGVHWLDVMDAQDLRSLFG